MEPDKSLKSLQAISAIREICWKCGEWTERTTMCWREPGKVPLEKMTFQLDIKV